MAGHRLSQLVWYKQRELLLLDNGCDQSAVCRAKLSYWKADKRKGVSWVLTLLALQNSSLQQYNIHQIGDVCFSVEKYLKMIIAGLQNNNLLCMLNIKEVEDEESKTI